MVFNVVGYDSQAAPFEVATDRAGSGKQIAKNFFATVGNSKINLIEKTEQRMFRADVVHCR